MRIMLIGPVSAGKTTLCQYLAGLPLENVKTQTVEQIGDTIDTPGEYMENRRWWNRLTVTSADADLVLFIQDSTGENFQFSPGQASMFGCPVAGVVTKTDLAGEREIENIRELLVLAGASPIFAVSPITGDGMEALNSFIRKQV